MNGLKAKQEAIRRLRVIEEHLNLRTCVAAALGGSASGGKEEKIEEILGLFGKRR